MGIIRMRGRQHAHYRQLILPTLARQSVNAMGDKMLDLASDEVGSWPTGRTIDLCGLAQKLMRHLTIGLLFGDDRAHGYPVADMISSKGRWSIRAAFCPVMLPGTAYYRMMRQAEALERGILK
jgi:cytochrome P450